MLVDDLRSLDLFEGLSDHQLSQLAAAGTEVRVEPGERLFDEGAHADFWWVLLDGAIDLIRHVGREDTVVGRMDVPGRWAGGFRAWDEHGVYLATGQAVVPARVLRVPAPALGALSNEWFPFAGHLIQGLYSTARSIESTARQRQSLVALGTLAAGLAHEINNPVAAAARAVGSLQGESQALLDSLRHLAEANVTSGQFSELDELRREIEPLRPALDPLAVANQEEELSAWLVRHGVDRDWLVAPPLAAAGVDLGWCERVAAVLDGPALGPGLEWVASTLSVATLMAEVTESTRRVSGLVAAVRTYSQMDRGAVQRTDVREGLESTLVMLGHKIGDGVEVVRSYGDDVPHVEAFAGELNQVWTNLVDNAVDAMDGVGTLGLTTRADGDHVVVEISDSGTGMTPEVAARAFEAFYTTKDVGKGTGLGLDIARRIVVERHGGDLSVDSRPGRTTMRVRLPVRPTGT